MATETPTPPSTPRKDPDASRAEISDVQLNIRRTISHLNYEWDLGLDTPSESPSKYGMSTEKNLQRSCASKIRYICWKSSIDNVMRAFIHEADRFWQSWINKQGADPDFLPKATHRQHSLTSAQRIQLLNCLYRNLTDASDSIMRTLGNSRSSTPNREGNGRQEIFGPVLFPLTTSTESKRPREDSTFEASPSPKKVRKPELAESMPPSSEESSFMLLPIRMKAQRLGLGTSAKTSFTSFNSRLSNIFDRSPLDTLFSTITQETVHDDEENLSPIGRGSFVTSQPDETNNSDYRYSNFDFNAADDTFAEIAAGDEKSGLHDELKLTKQGSCDQHGDESQSQDLQCHGSGKDFLKSSLGVNFQDGLCEGFCKLPNPALETASFAVIYEITRIFLHAGVSMTDVDFPDPKPFNDYEVLWQFLKNLPILKGRSFPEKCGGRAWSAALNGFNDGFRGVLLSGNLRLVADAPMNSVFKLQLEPLKLDLSHRLGRRLGNDRFLEIDIPDLAGIHIPKALAKHGDRGRRIFLEWLVDGKHSLFGRTWQSFYTKTIDKKQRKGKTNKKNEIESVFRVHFFATSGVGFKKCKNPLFEPVGPVHTVLSIPNLLNFIRPTRKNAEESYLKLFARTQLALSRNSATVLLERDQIIYKEDIKFGTDVMTDGGGRISPALALLVMEKLGLSYMPSGFQARLGEAKGFWTVCHDDKSGEPWIEVYKSQRKWIRSRKQNGESDDVSHNIFEVVRCSAPLESASLNMQFLPILMDGAEDPEAMRSSISQLLVQDLSQELSELHKSMETPQLLRKWIRESQPSIDGRLKLGVVSYQAGLPESLEERLNMMLDAGFEPQKLHFIKEMTKTIFKNKCEKLKERMNITIGKSAHVFMIPDFWEVLEPDEVYIDFSTFKDKVTGFSGVHLNAEHVLVARSPSHFASDIQKVKVVAKTELMGLKDVIVFPVKGNPSLAQKLSGGDYDGDMAWVCWEPTIVNNFKNTEVPEQPDLVNLGYIHKDGRTYEQLVAGHSEPASVFLKESFSFALRPSMLGICTNFKQKVNYTQDSVKTEESVWLSTLLSSLVDQAKSGFTFTHDDWARFKRDIIKIKVRPYLYEAGLMKSDSKNIIDSLMYVAKQATEKAIDEFHNRIPDPPYWDEDLVVYYNWARDVAKDDEDMEALLDQLDSELTALKDSWKVQFGNPNKNRKSEFKEIIHAHFEKFVAICPSNDSRTAQLLLPSCLPNPEVSDWALLKASALFASYNRRYVPPFVWYMAGKQLGRLKAMYRQGSFPCTVVPEMNSMLKPDTSYVKRWISGVSVPSLGLMEVTEGTSEDEAFEYNVND